VPYRIDLRHPRGDALDRLVDVGALDVDMTPDGRLEALLPDDVPVATVAAALRVDALEVSAALGRDDGSTWILRPRPVHVGGLVLAPADVTPAPADVTPAQATLRLIDGAAFGSGLHPTTALCLDAIQQAAGSNVPASILDVGTGSGVLALAALAHGVPQAVGLDVDPAALSVAATNARLNNLSSRLRLICGGPEAVGEQWPLVVANILAAPLIDMAPTLARRLGRGGRLVLSGIHSSLVADVEAAYRPSGMHVLHAETRAGWTVLTLAGSW
jgi:ribosomal protein L11 methyltransferase